MTVEAKTPAELDLLGVEGALPPPRGRVREGPRRPSHEKTGSEGFAPRYAWGAPRRAGGTSLRSSISQSTVLATPPQISQS